jgi:hypothetical protein
LNEISTFPNIKHFNKLHYLALYIHPYLTL